MTIAEIKDAARIGVAELVQRFSRDEAGYLQTAYGETQTRSDFITPLLEIFGWDVRNQSGRSQALREVIEEATVEVGVERLAKKPDYELRLARQRKYFVEAKKPSVKIDRDKHSAFQTRRYGYSASLPISILTNFHQLAIYDCTHVPKDTDAASVARILLIFYTDFEARFDELWATLSRHAVYSGEFDQHYAVDVTRRGANQFDDFFLGQVRSWRERLANDIHANTPNLTPEELTYSVQRFLSRIIFLRICEDRDIERYEALKGLVSLDTFPALMEKLREADEFYDSGLFRLLDEAPLGIRISNEILQTIISELYYPQSPYTFAVVETEVLGEIYEQFLGEIITVDHGAVRIVSKPEVRESGGVVPTPRYIVDSIVERTLGPVLIGKSPADLAGFTAADPCCGSGIFLLSIFEHLVDHYLSWYLNNNRDAHIGHAIYEVVNNQWRLTFEEKRRIILKHIRGVDIDSNAIEIAHFSLLLKLIEDETESGLQEYVNRTHTRALPSLDNIILSGNSLVSEQEWANASGPIPTNLIDKINPFTWETEFAAEFAAGGFNLIVANPPYIRIQKMTAYSPEEITYYKNIASPYTTARNGNFDKYAIFIERSLSLLRPDGRLGVIVPHKFMVTKSGKALRRIMSEGQLLEEVVHFGTKPVFGKNVANYTCILVMNKSGQETIRAEKAGPLEAWRYGSAGTVIEIGSDTLGDDGWQFENVEVLALFERINTEFTGRLGRLSDVFVGAQTGNDSIYIFAPGTTTANTVTLNWNGRDWPIERQIVRPSMYKVQLNPYAKPEHNRLMIFPYHLTIDDGKTRAHIIQPDEMLRDYPGCLAYLQARQGELENRTFTGGIADERQFYRFGRSQSLTKFSGPKIILPNLSLEPRYAFDDNNITVTGGGSGPYYMVRALDGADVSNYFLLAILNHPLSEAFVRTKTSTFGGGYCNHSKQYIENLPIPIPSEERRIDIEQNVIYLISTYEALTAARLPNQKTRLGRQARVLKERIESQVSAMFNLTPTELDTIRAIQSPG